EADLRHQLRLEPARPSRDGVRRRVVEGGRLARQALEAARQVLELARVEAGADAADITQPALLVDGEEERRERPVLFGDGVADDDELLLKVAFDLEPVASTARAIGPVGALGDDAFEVLPAEGLQHRSAIAVEMVGQEDRAVPAATRQQLLQAALALDQRQVAKVPATGEQQIEDEVGQSLAALAQRVLE